jgi:hypothetical protein
MTCSFFLSDKKPQPQQYKNVEIFFKSLNCSPWNKTLPINLNNKTCFNYKKGFEHYWDWQT